ncbi:MAG: hypothetical protein ACOYOB_10055 [Myxococcota bacterium]
MTKPSIPAMRVVAAAWTCLALAPAAWAEPAAASDLAIAETATSEDGGLTAGTAEPDDKIEFRLSLPTEADTAAWRKPGFRLQLGYGYGRLFGIGGPPDGSTHSAIVRVGGRLDDDWSLYTTFQYGAALGGLSGARFSGTLDPTWHVSDRWRLAIGMGFGGLVEGRTGRDDPDAEQAQSLVESYTFPNARRPLAACVGIGTAGLVRVGWTAVLGALSSTELSLQVDGQWTGCEQSLGRVEPDTAEPIVRRQWWPHVGASLAWLVGWR